jgi:hypothetical protein
MAPIDPEEKYKRYNIGGSDNNHVLDLTEFEI